MKAYHAPALPSSSSYPPYKTARFKLSVDLAKAALHQLTFLEMVDHSGDGCYYDVTGACMRRALWRYEVLWLPLAWKHHLLAAPLDVHWLWHVHMLAPDKYRTDCTRVLQSHLHEFTSRTGQSGNNSSNCIVVDHRCLSLHKRQIELQRAEKLWTQSYPNEPFQWSNYDFLATAHLSEFHSKVEYNLLEAVTRQKSFFYQVSLPHYRNLKFLHNGLKRYQKLLYIKQQHPDVFIVPCLDSDLIWHTHQLHPMAYYKDTTTLLQGRFLPHDDSVTERIAPDAKLVLSDAVTRKWWNFHFPRDTYFHAGAMFRGDPLMGQMHCMTKAHLFDIVEKTVCVSVQSVSSSLSAEDSYQILVMADCSNWKSKDPTKILYKQTVTNKVESRMHQMAEAHHTNSCNCIHKSTDTFLTLASSSTSVAPSRMVHVSQCNADSIKNKTMGIQIQQDVTLPLKWNNRVHIKMYKKKKRPCSTNHVITLFQSEELLWPHFEPQMDEEKCVTIRKQLPKIQEAAKNAPRLVNECFPVQEPDGINIHLQIQSPKPFMYSFHLHSSEFYFVKIPAQEEVIQQFWGPIHAFHIIRNKEHFVWMSVLQLVNHINRTVFEVRVIHSVKHCLSVVQVYFNQSLVALAHSIGHDQLPTPQIGGQNNIALDLAKGSRAMLIKDKQGDWAVVTGQWKGFSTYLGDMNLYLHTLRTNRRTYSTQVQNTMNQLHALNVDFKKGNLSMNGNTEDVAQNVCLAFASATLMVLCQPRIIVADTKVSSIIALPVDWRFNGEAVRNKLPIGNNLHSTQQFVDIEGIPLSQMPICFVNTENYTMMVACGYTFDHLTPCNSLLVMISKERKMMTNLPRVLMQSSHENNYPQREEGLVYSNFPFYWSLEATMLYCLTLDTLHESPLDDVNTNGGGWIGDDISDISDSSGGCGGWGGGGCGGGGCGGGGCGGGGCGGGGCGGGC